MRSVLCLPILTPSIDVLVNGINVCLARYTMCRSLLLEKVNMFLDKYNKKLSEFDDGDDLYEKIYEIIKNSGKVKMKGIKSIDEREIAARALAVILPSYIATLSILGVECEIPVARHGGK